MIVELLMLPLLGYLAYQLDDVRKELGFLKERVAKVEISVDLYKQILSEDGDL